MANHAHVAIKTESKEKILRLVAEAILSMFLFFFFFCILIKNPIADIDNWLSLEDPIALRHHIAVVLPFSSSHVLYTITTEEILFGRKMERGTKRPKDITDEGVRIREPNRFRSC